jgi:uncharacterized membrane protein HdeD (DUF308 family)
MEETPLMKLAKASWGITVLESIAAIIIGLLLLFQPMMTTLVLVQLLGIYWLIAGILSLVSLFFDRTQWGWKLFGGIVGILAGFCIIRYPLWSAVMVPTTLMIVLGVFGIMIGVTQLVQAFSGGGWALGLLGALSIIVGFLLLINPVAAGLTAPWTFGILAVAGGIAALITAFSVRDQMKHFLRDNTSSRTPTMQ